MNHGKQVLQRRAGHLASRRIFFVAIIHTAIRMAGIIALKSTIIRIGLAGTSHARFSTGGKKMHDVGWQAKMAQAVNAMAIGKS
jgi:hypothetical protein